MSRRTVQAEDFPRWLIEANGLWRVLEPIQLLTSIYAAAKRAGERDPFIVQEIAESVRELLVQEWQGRRVITESEWKEGVAALLGQLGRPEWARQFSELGNQAAESTITAFQANVDTAQPAGTIDLSGEDSKFPWQEVWARGLASCAAEALETMLPEPLAELHRQGCISWHAIYHPRQLAAASVSLLPQGPFGAGSAGSSGWPIFEYWEYLRSWVGQAVEVWTPEWELLQVRLGEVPRLARELALASRYLGLSGVLHFNQAEQERRLSPSAGLYAQLESTPSSDRLASLREALCEALRPWLGITPLQIVWHFDENEQADAQWHRWMQTWLAGAPGRPALAVGVSRFRQNRANWPATETILAVVGISMTQVLAGWHDHSPTRMLQRCQSLVRSIAEALVQWRECLRPFLSQRTPPFVLERTCGAIYLTGLELAARHWFDALAEQNAWLKQLLTGIRHTLKAAVERGAPRCLLLGQCPRWLSRSGFRPETHQESFWQIHHAEDCSGVRRHWQQWGHLFDRLELEWELAPESSGNWDQVGRVAAKLCRLPNVVQIWLNPTQQPQPGLF